LQERKEKKNYIILEAGFYNGISHDARIFWSIPFWYHENWEMRTAGLHRIVDTKRYRIHLFSLVACRDRPACNWPVHLREKTLAYLREKRNNSEQTERKYHRKYVAFHICA